ncbi:MAG: BlaI/MecI/CopY family transcriptional regulator [Thermoleophilia bacterium]|nr:BlaI/MecI/CopY family transcriptional regulator [Thermoleophilia bacterium]
MALKRKKSTRLINLKTSNEGIRQVLGDLEADIMELLWQKSPASVRDVHESLAQTRPIAYTTAMTVMSRLAEKGILKREQHGRAYLYAPTQSREEFCSETISTVMRGLLGGFGEPVLSNFVETVGAEDAGKLDELLRLIEQKKGEADRSAT